MKVYLDMQLWVHMKSDENVKRLFLEQKEKNGWEYYISVAHLEELFHNEKTENDKHQGDSEELFRFIKQNINSKVISPIPEGLALDNLEAANKRVRTIDTQDIVAEVAKFGLQARNTNRVDPCKLFAERYNL